MIHNLLFYAVPTLQMTTYPPEEEPPVAVIRLLDEELPTIPPDVTPLNPFSKLTQHLNMSSA